MNKKLYLVFIFLFLVLPLFSAIQQVEQTNIQRERFVWNLETEAFRYNGDGYSFDIELTVNYSGQERTMDDVRKAFPGLITSSYIDLESSDNKFGVKFRNVPVEIAQNIDNFNYRVVGWENITIDEIERINDYTILIKNSTTLSFQDLIDNEYNLTRPDKFTVSVFGDSRHYVNGTIDLDPSLVETTTSSAFSWLHTVSSGTDRVLVVSVVLDDNSATDRMVNNITANDTMLTKQVESDDNTVQHREEIWTLTNPDTGVLNITVTVNGVLNAFSGASLTFVDVDQTTPVGNTTSGTFIDSATVNTTIITLYDNSALIDADGTRSSSGDPTPDSGQEFYLSDLSARDRYGTWKNTTTAGSYTMGYSGFGVLADTTQAIIELVPTQGGGDCWTTSGNIITIPNGCAYTKASGEVEVL